MDFVDDSGLRLTKLGRGEGKGMEMADFTEEPHFVFPFLRFSGFYVLCIVVVD